jgi:hypothetical protein
MQAPGNGKLAQRGIWRPSWTKEGDYKMSDAAMWREKAHVLRERANRTSDPEEESALLTLANDCDELADLEAALAPPKAG